MNDILYQKNGHRIFLIALETRIHQTHMMEQMHLQRCGLFLGVIDDDNDKNTNVTQE